MTDQAIQIREQKNIPVLFNVNEKRLREFVEDVKKDGATEESLAEKWLSPGLEYVNDFTVVEFAGKKLLIGRELFEKTEMYIDKELIVKWGKDLKVSKYLEERDYQDVDPVELIDEYSQVQMLMLAETGAVVMNGDIGVDLLTWAVKKAPEMREELRILINEDLENYEAIPVREHSTYMYNVTRDEFVSLIKWIREETVDFELMKYVLLPPIDSFHKADCIVKLTEGQLEEYQLFDYSQYVGLELLNPFINFSKLLKDPLYSNNKRGFKHMVSLITHDPYEVYYYKFGLVEDDDRSLYGIWEQIDECAIASQITIDTFAKWFYDHRTEFVQEEEMIEHFCEYFIDEQLDELYFKIDGLKRGQLFEEVLLDYETNIKPDAEPELDSGSKSEETTKKRCMKDDVGVTTRSRAKKAKTC